MTSVEIFRGVVIHFLGLVREETEYQIIWFLKIWGSHVQNSEEGNSTLAQQMGDP